jgi:hypothetical protein
VDDDGVSLGLADDFSTLSKGNADGFELAVRQRLDTSLSAPTAHTVRMHFHQVEGKEVCAINVSPAGNPVFAKGPVLGNVPPTANYVARRKPCDVRLGESRL